MTQWIEVFNQILPILILIFLGYWIRFKGFLTETTIDELRKIIVNFALPAVLFISFINVELQSSYFIIFGVTFLLCILMFLFGRLVRKQFSIQHTYFPYLVTGFEYGMLGISLFGTAYGMDKIGHIAIVDLGHEIFIWFVFLPLLLTKRDGVKNVKEAMKSFSSSPVIIAILAGILFNMLSAKTMLYQLPLTGAFMSVFQLLGNLTAPLILITVGYNIKVNRTGFGNALLVVIIRLVILVPLALLINSYVIRDMLSLDRLFEAALFTLFILPPPFIIPLYIAPNKNQEEKEYINNVLTLHTIVSVAIFIIYFSYHPMA